MTSIPMNNLRRRYLRHEADLLRISRDVLASGNWISGPHNAAFCREFAAATSVAYCIGVGNGSDALEIALRCVVTDPARREVVTVANAGGYTTTACRLIGLTPVYVDVVEASQLVAIDQTVAAVGPATGAVVVTHLYGGLVDVPALRAALRSAGFSGVPIIEDCAQAHGLRGCGAGAGAFGDLATFSFYPTKNLGGLGDGGAILTNDAALAAQVARLRMYGWDGKYDVVTNGGRNSRLDELQAAFLAAMLSHLEADNERRLSIIDAYRAAGTDGIEWVSSPHGNVGHLAVVLTNDRDRLAKHLNARGVATAIHFPILDCDQTGWAGAVQRIGPAGIDVSRRSVKRILSVPCFPEMSDDEIAHVCDALGSYSA
ncbi:DegT/DnrJ/EryC1/StrS family aminotransferase [Sphingomonas pruni]|uniref:DegT/DnrJ/EryC1/StrS family aminotransferase n=1 Tax=Sphingomonas pruni TaxID=40683 RepID=UPI000829A588|nr:DegT/DnrJ/EryC1/StrS family aminotransferase [Sphingomonas pruni]